MAYKSRLKHPIRYALAISLLMQTHFIVAGLVLALTIMFIFDYIQYYRSRKKKPKKIKPFVAALGVMLLSGLTLLPPIVNSLTSHDIISSTMTRETISRFSYLHYANLTVFGIDFPIIQIAIVASLLFLLFQHLRQFIILGIAAGFQVFLMTFIYFAPGITQRNLTFLLYLILAIWISTYDRPRETPLISHVLDNVRRAIAKLEIARISRRFFIVRRSVLIAIPCLISIPYTVSAVIYDLNHEYSLSRTVSSYIRQHLPDGAIIIPSKDCPMEAITFAPYLPHTHFWSAVNQNFFTYVSCKIRQPPLSSIELQDRISSNFTSSDHLYYLEVVLAVDNHERPAHWTFVQEFITDTVTPSCNQTFGHGSLTEKHFILYKIQFSEQ
jgi:hypothetical protein